jgi:hypothetical protein
MWTAEACADPNTFPPCAGEQVPAGLTRLGYGSGLSASDRDAVVMPVICGAR